MPLEDARHEAIGDAFYGVLARLAAQDGARLVGLDGEELHVFVDLAESLSDPDERAAGPDAHHKRVGDAPFGELSEDLRPEPHPILLDVPLGLELRGAEKAVPLPELPGFRQCLVDVEVPNF